MFLEAPAPAQGALTDAEIERLALANGFKRKQQPDGTLALNPYVFDFARAVRGQVSDAADADKRDAARYRWLRQCATGTDQAYVCLTTDFESMDEACDAAIQAQAGDEPQGESA